MTEKNFSSAYNGVCWLVMTLVLALGGCDRIASLFVDYSEEAEEIDLTPASTYSPATASSDVSASNVSDNQNAAVVSPSSDVSNGRSISVRPIYGGLQNSDDKKYAFLVGAYDYDANVPALSFPGVDVAAVKARLIEIGFPEENVFVLRSGGGMQELPTKKHILDRYEEFLSKANPEGVVLVYLSGHGLQLEESPDVSWFAPVDVDLKDVPNTGVSINEMISRLADTPAQFRLMLVDACRNDPKKSENGSVVDASGVKTTASIKNVPDSISLLQSCEPGAFSYEGGGNKDSNVQNGLFTLAFLEAIGKEGKGDLNGDGSVFSLEICKYVMQRTNELANYYYGVPQNPILLGGSTDFAFLEGLKEDEASKLYQEVCDLILKKDYPSALEKMKAVCQKAPQNQEYAKTRDSLQEIIDGTAKIAEKSGKAGEERAVYDKAEDERKSAQARRERLAEKMKETKQKAEEVVRLTAKSNNFSSLHWSASPAAGTRATLTYNGVEFAFHYCPPGSFMRKDDNGDLRKVTLTRGFWIQETETTQEQWDAVGLKKEKECGFKGDKLPVETLKWEECFRFAVHLNQQGAAPCGLKFALPTDAQWEYACRAGTQTKYYWGDKVGRGHFKCGYFDPAGNSERSQGTIPVGSYSPNPWGLYDMYGNVSELCADFYKRYPNEDVVDPDPQLVDFLSGDMSEELYENFTGYTLMFVSQGGCWDSYVSSNLISRSTFCDNKDCGFRLVLVK